MRPVAKRLLLRLTAPAQGRLVSVEQHARGRMTNLAGALQLQRAIGPQRDARRTAACCSTVGSLMCCGVVSKCDLRVTPVAIRLLPGAPATTQPGVRLM